MTNKNCPECGMPLKLVEDRIYASECGSVYEIIDESDNLVLLDEGTACSTIAKHNKRIEEMELQSREAFKRIKGSLNFVDQLTAGNISHHRANIRMHLRESLSMLNGTSELLRFKIKESKA